MNELLPLILSIVSIIIACISFLLNFFDFKRESFNQAYFSNENHIIEIESRIGAKPDLLRFHGVENPQEFLKSHGIDSDEFAYLVNSFTAGSIFYNTANPAEKEKLLQPGSYRWKMCKSPATKKAWPAVKLLLAKGEFRDKIESLINE